MLDWFAGDFRRAHARLESAAKHAGTIGHDDDVASSWLNPLDPKASIHTHLALARFVRGMQQGADDELDQAADRSAGLAFPQGPFSAAYVLAFTAWMRIEAGDLDGAEAAVERLTGLSEHHGFDSWMLVAVTERNVVTTLRALYAADPDPSVLATQAGMVQGLIAAWDKFDIKLMVPFYLTMLGAVVAATGDDVAARSHFEASLALAKVTGMHFYDAETLRRAALLNTDPSEVVSGLRDALRTARTQGACLFELRTALDLCQYDATSFTADLQAAARLFPPGARYPELARAPDAAGREG
jgi:hypothetical protein